MRGAAGYSCRNGGWTCDLFGLTSHLNCGIAPKLSRRTINNRARGARFINSRPVCSNARYAIPRRFGRLGTAAAVRSKYERKMAFMRDWYRGPVSRKKASTSESTRREMGIFAAGSTATASSQKSGGRSRNSLGAVRIVAHDQAHLLEHDSIQPTPRLILGDSLAQEPREGERGLGRIVRGDLMFQSFSKGRHDGRRSALSHSPIDVARITPSSPARPSIGSALDWCNASLGSRWMMPIVLLRWE